MTELPATIRLGRVLRGYRRRNGSRPAPVADVPVDARPAPTVPPPTAPVREPQIAPATAVVAPAVVAPVAAVGEAEAEDEAGGTWPHTQRLLPWLVAMFLTMLWLVPFTGITAPFNIGVDTKLDRVVLVVMVVAWIIVAAVPGRYGTRFRRTPLNVAILFFLFVTILGVVLRLPVLQNLGETQLAVKKLALLATYIVFFFFVASSVRQREVINFTKFMVFLASLTAAGSIIEYRTHTNLFYIWSAKLLPGGFGVASPPSGTHTFGRVPVVGPTQAPLALATILAIALPFAIVFLLHAKDRRDRMLWYTAVGLIVIASVSTIRKSAVVIPAATLAALFVLSPRQMLKFVPALLVFAVALQVVSPGAGSSLRYQFDNISTSASTQGRTEDYAAITPDILAEPVLGRGYGSYDHKVYRVLDNEYLVLLVSTGFVGLAAYVLILVTGGAIALKAARSGDPTRAPPGRALFAAIVGFLVAGAMFDLLAFAQGPYLLLFVLALAVVSNDSASGTASRWRIPGLGARAAGRDAAPASASS